MRAGQALIAAAGAPKACAAGGTVAVTAAVERLLDSGVVRLDRMAWQLAIHVGDRALFGGAAVASQRPPGT